MKRIWIVALIAAVTVSGVLVVRRAIAFAEAVRTDKIRE